MVMTYHKKEIEYDHGRTIMILLWYKFGNIKKEHNVDVP